jgi:gliding motility-associated-like protein
MVFKKNLIRRLSAVVLGTILLCSFSRLNAQGNCPDVEINFLIDSVICYDPNVSLIDLEVEVIGGNGTGTGVWSGPHITNATDGIFRTTFALPGEHQVKYTYTEGACVYTDSTTFLLSRISPPFIQASFERDGHLCEDSTSVVEVLSPFDPNTTNLVWDFSGGTGVEQGRPDLLHVNWDSPGSKLISLRYEQYGCLSQPAIAQVILDPTIETPVVACDNTLERVVYDWVDPPNSSATVVFVISGPNGVADTVRDRYTIENLMPGQIVQVRMVTTSKNTCDGNFIDPICQSATCDGSLIDILPITAACVTGGAQDTIDLEYFLSDTVTQSTLTWSGAGVFDPTQPRIVVDPSMAGQTQWVYLTFEFANCTVTDSVSFDLIPPPVADFSIPATACEGESVSAQFAFGPISANSDTTLIWDFDGATVVGGDPASGTAELSWSSTGTKIVSLAMRVGSCVSETVVRFVNVQGAPEAAVISCTPGPNSILFSWQDIQGATFDINVLQGPTGTRISTTSYEVTGLNNNEEVTIEVITEGAGLCNTRTATQSCMPSDCPAIDIVINPIDPVCADPNASPIDLTATINGGNGSGTLRWTGTNVSGSSWTPDPSQSGQTNFIVARYTEGACVYEDSIEVTVLDPLIANFVIPAQSCTGESIQLLATGNFPANADFSWSFNGVEDAALLGPGPHDIPLNTPGNLQIALDVDDGQCTAPTVSRFIRVAATLPDPVITCDATDDQIVFTWAPVPGAGAYQVNVLQGPAGNQTSDTSIVFTGLMPGEEIRIEVLLENGGPCPDSRGELSCRTPGCPNISLAFDETLLPAGGSLCIGDRDTSFTLAALVTGEVMAGGTLSFSGPGVSGTSWTASPAMAGQVITLIATYQQDGCTFAEDINIQLTAKPTADFSMPAAVCPADPATITFTGQASAAAVFNWSDPTLNGRGPHIFTYNNPGPANVDISLSVTDNGCTSETVTHSLEVYGQHAQPEVSCSSGLSEVVFTWLAAENMRQEVTYNGPGNGQQTSDTSYVVSGLAPDTDVNIEVRFLDDNFICRNVSTVASCTTGSCENLSLDWSAPATVCQGEAFNIAFTAVGAGTEGFDVVIRQGGSTLTYSGIGEGSTLPFTLNSDESFAVIAAGLPDNAGCAVTLPDPLTVAVSTPQNAGTQTIFPEVCSGTDTLINLINLLSNTVAGGEWSFVSGPQHPGSAFSAPVGTVRLDGLPGGNYLFNYSLEGSGGACSNGAATVAIEIVSSPLAHAGPDINLDCQFNVASIGSSLTSPGLSYQWTGGSAGAITDADAVITEVSQAGTYTLRVTDVTNGCSATDQVEVTASPGLIVPYASVIPISCYDSADGAILIDSIVGGQGPFSITINNNEQGDRRVFNNLPAGNYDLLVRSNDGCEAGLFLTIAPPTQLDLQITTDIDQDGNIISAGDSVRLTAQVNIPQEQIGSIRWTSAMGSAGSNSLNTTVSPLISTSYQVEITDINGCSVSDRISIIVQKVTNVFMASAFSPNEDGNNDIFYIQADQSIREIKYFSIYNRWGEQLFRRQNFQPNDPTQGWDGNDAGVRPQPTGVYVYQIELELVSGELLHLEGDITLMR